MDYIRLIHRIHFDSVRGEFKNIAFKRSSTDKGISVIERGCVDRSDRTVCEHIREFYEQRGPGDPPIYWQFEEEILPASRRIEQVTTASGDECHHNIYDLTPGQAKKVLKNNATIDDMRICDGNPDRPLTLDDLIEPT